jgi:hypothetical protein
MKDPAPPREIGMTGEAKKSQDPRRFIETIGTEIEVIDPETRPENGATFEKIARPKKKNFLEVFKSQ